MGARREHASPHARRCRPASAPLVAPLPVQQRASCTGEVGCLRGDHSVELILALMCLLLLLELNRALLLVYHLMFERSQRKRMPVEH